MGVSIPPPPSIGGGPGTGGPGRTDQAIIAPSEAESGGVYNTFAAALAAATPDDIDRTVLVAHEMNNDLSNAIIAAHDGAENAAVFSDSSQAWTVDELVGRFIWNQNDGSFGKITANTATDITAVMNAGDERLWDNGDSGVITYGIAVPDPGSGTMDLFGVVLSGTNAGLASYNFEDGAKIKNVYAIGPDCQIRALGLSRVIEPSGSPFGESVRIERGATLVGGHLAPVIHAADGETWEVHMFGGVVGDNSGVIHPAITQAGAGEVRIYLHDDARIRENSLGGDDGSKFEVKRLSDATEVSTTHSGIIAGAINVDESKIAAAAHAPDHSAAGADALDVGTLATGAALDFVPHSDGGGAITMKAVVHPSAIPSRVEIPAIGLTGSTLPIGTPVYAVNWTGTHYTVAQCDANAGTNKWPVIGVVSGGSIDSGNPGVVTVAGEVTGSPMLGAFGNKDRLWVGDAAMMVNTPPASPSVHLPFAVVLDGPGGRMMVNCLGFKGSLEDLAALGTNKFWFGASGNPSEVSDAPGIDNTAVHSVGNALMTSPDSHTGNTNWEPVVGGSTGSLTLLAGKDYRVSVSAEVKTSSAPVYARIRIYDVTAAAEVVGAWTDQIVDGQFRAVYDVQTPGAGVREYRLEMMIDNGAQTVTVNRASLLVEEM